MHDPLAVRRVQRIGDLNREIEQRFDRKRLAGDPIPQRPPLHQLHGDEGLPLVLVDVVDGADAGVVEGGGRVGLPLEAFERLRVAGEVRGQELEGDETTELRILGLVDDPHAAAAQLLDDTVVGDALADHGDDSPAGRS